MKKALIILFTLSNLLVYAQRNFRLGFSLYSNVSLPLYVADNSNQWAADIWRDVEQPKFSFGANAFVEYELAKRKTITIGLGYLNYGEQTKKYSSEGFSFPEEIDPFYGFVRPQNESSSNFEWRNVYTIHSIEFPMSFRYYFKNGVYTAAGMTLLAQITQIRFNWKKYQGESPTKTFINEYNGTLRPINMAINASLGYTFLQHKKVNWFVAAQVQHVVFGVMQNVNINRKYISAGITTGILF